MTEEAKETEDKKPAAETSAATPAKKKNNTVLIIVIAVIIIFFVLPVLALWGLGFMAKNKINDIEKNGISLDGGNVKVNPSEDGWPSTMPSDVPKFDDGNVESSSKIGEVVSVIFTDVESSEVANYKADVLAAGWTMVNEATVGGGTMQIIVTQKGAYTLTINYKTASKGLTISASKV